ncbi:MAG: NUDIX domain-containing protein [Nanoarchaeota archaeon]|nr:NUDIX domain-containing protein [Nanoarchaeota archaeon]
MDRPKVGVGVFVFKDGKFLLMHRKGSHGSGTWCPPGGHLEGGEEPEECAKRETMEEIGVKIKNLRRGPWTNDVFIEENKHYITLCIISDYDSGEPKIMEPDKCTEWRWVTWEDMPKPLFLPTLNLKKSGWIPPK